MSPGTIFFKTDKGRAELAQRGGIISAGERRLLILVDGSKTVNSLAALVRAGELDSALQALCAQELIASSDVVAVLPAPVAPGFSSAIEAEPPRPATNAREFTSLRAEASGFVADRLGEAAGPICAAIDQCKNPTDLRKMLRGVEIFVGDQLSATEAQQFARHFGTLLL